MNYNFPEEEYVLTLPDGRDLRLPNIGMLDNFARFLRYPVFAPDDRPLRIVDAGACVGGFSLAVKRSVPNAVIDAFEPYPPCWPYLAHNLRGVPDVTVHQTGLGETAGRVFLGRPNTASTTIGQTSLYGQLTGAVEVPVERLDDALTGTVDVLKADVEGAELDVLRGARRILADERPLLLLELKEVNQGRSGRTVRDVTDWLASHGYGPPEKVIHGDYLFVPRKPKAGLELGTTEYRVTA